ncbi:head GIN domain-containing protein [uncultured Psychroserpens sp.]|uniref:head GIN domain-containing protein n=1 Tax=uncultured Psychroserpens sp. TaxID=255436 RepID=UPI0026200F94|nr:head GIN domain-containing protein [uncultured Psychroserpens sp.]
MKTSALLTALLLCVTFSFAGNKKIKGNGKVITITRTTSDYDGIKCSGSFDYVLVSGSEGKITVEGEENLLEYIVTEVKDNNLIVKVKNHTNIRTSNGKTIKITIPFKDIEKVTLSGSGDLWNEDVITATDLEVALAGSGDINLDVQASNTIAKVAGSGDLTIKGNTNQLEAKVAGSGDFDGFDLQSNHTVVAVAGSGDAKVVSKESLKARVAGSGDIKYKGNPKIQDTKVSGSGSINN